MRKLQLKHFVRSVQADHVIRESARSPAWSWERSNVSATKHVLNVGRVNHVHLYHLVRAFGKLKPKKLNDVVNSTEYRPARIYDSIVVSNPIIYTNLDAIFVTSGIAVNVSCGYALRRALARFLRGALPLLQGTLQVV